MKKLITQYDEIMQEYDAARLREARGISQQVLADSLGVTQQSLSRYEKGQRQPSIDLAILFFRNNIIVIRRVIKWMSTKY